MDGELGSAQNLRQKRLTIAAWIAVLGGANVIAALIGLIALQIAIAILTLVALATVAVLQTRELRAERSAHLDSLLRVPIKKVRNLKAHEAGVAPEAPQALTSMGHSDGSEYLPRDIDALLDAALETARKDTAASLIVVSGPSKAGKTRALFEAMQRHLPDAQAIAPVDAEALEELMKPGALPGLAGKSAVLWLDDLELYLRVGPHGMHQGVLEQLSARDGKFVVLATAGGKGLLQAGDDATQFSVPMVELLRHAREIALSSHLSGNEQLALQRYAPDAAERIAQDGIGEYMIAAPDLERKLTTGCHHPGDESSPHGQAIAHAAIDWQRVGITDPIPRAVLRDVYASYLPDHVDPSDEAFDEGLDWARRPLYSTVALISGRDELQPYDHIVAYVESSLDREVDDETWLHFLNASTGEQAFDLASSAYGRGKTDPDGKWRDLAERATRHAMDSDAASTAAVAAFNLGVLLEERGDLQEAEAAYRLAEERGEPSGAINLGNLRSKAGDPEGAEAAYRRAEEQGDVSGSFNLGNVLREGGDLDSAEAAYRRADERGHAKAAFNLGKMLGEGGDLDSAEAAYRRADERGHAKAACNLGNLLREAGDPAGAEAAYRRAEERGHEDAACNLGSLFATLGDLEGAEAAYRRAAGQGHAVGAFNWGVMLVEKGDLQSAETAFSQADELGEADGSFALGVLLAERGDPVGSEAALRRAAERGHVKASAVVKSLSEESESSEAAKQDVGVGDQSGGDQQQDRGDED